MDQAPANAHAKTQEPENQEYRDKCPKHNFSRAHGLSTLHMKFDSRQINRCSVLLLRREERSVELRLRRLPLEGLLAANTPCSPGDYGQALGADILFALDADSKLS